MSRTGKNPGGCVALVGGSGFIGSRLAARLSTSETPFRIVDIARSAVYPDRWCQGDVTEGASLDGPLAECGAVVNLAAVHHDNVRPRSRYVEVNVDGAGRVCDAAVRAGIDYLVFTSSAAVYGNAPPDTNEDGPLSPINAYGRTKLEAEAVYRGWQAADRGRRTLVIVRPTVVFGEGNRGNVYNLLRLIAGRRFLMVGPGTNVKSMAYVENVAAFLQHCLSRPPGLWVYNYADKPDLSMGELVDLVRRHLGIGVPPVALPALVARLGGYVFDALSQVSGKSFPISAQRVTKFLATTQFASDRARAAGFSPPVELLSGLRRTLDHEFRVLDA